MILRRLRLRNFRLYREAEFVFPEGVVGIVGPNGAGKSTIFEAVGWALFGNRLSRTGGFGLTSTEAGSGAPCSAELEIEVQGKVYRVDRRLTYGGVYTWAQVFEGGTLLATGDAPTRKVLRRLLGIRAARFIKTIHARQGELGGLARDTPDYRRRFIEELLELDWVDRARGRVALDRETLERACRQSRPTDVGAEPELLAQVEQAARRLELLEGEARALRASLEESEGHRVAFLALRAEVELTAKSLQALDRALSERARAAEAPGSAAVDAAAEDLIQSRIAEAKGRESAAASQLARLSRHLDALAGDRGNRCPVCGGPFSLDARRRLNGECLNLKKEHDSALLERRRLALQLEDVRRLRERTRRAAAVAVDLERLRAERSALAAKHASASTAVARSKFDPAAHEEMRKRLGEQGEALGSARAIKAGLEERMARAQSRKDADLRLSEGRQRIDLLTVLEELLADFRSAVANGFLPVFERECSQLMASATEGRYTRLLLDKDFNPRMQDGSRAYVLSRFSGGEQDVACLAMRLAMVRLSSRTCPLEFAVLDEVFGSQDRLRRRSLLRALGRLCPPFRQVFVVTHAEDVQELLPQTLGPSLDVEKEGE